jgi:hypothetical protein
MSTVRSDNTNTDLLFDISEGSSSALQKLQTTLDVSVREVGSLVGGYTQTRVHTPNTDFTEDLS